MPGFLDDTINDRAQWHDFGDIIKTARLRTAHDVQHFSCLYRRTLRVIVILTALCAETKSIALLRVRVLVLLIGHRLSERARRNRPHVFNVRLNPCQSFSSFSILFRG